MIVRKPSLRAMALLLYLYLLSSVLLPLSSSALTYPYGETFTGDGTYYGEIPLGDANCAFDDPQPSIYDGMIPMAVSKYNMYDGSAICGACLEGSASGAGSGSDPLPTTFKGFVSDSCGECADGDLDFATVGDGRWDVTWQFVECPAGGDPTFIFEGSNSFYWKVQARETATPVIQLSVDGVEATMTEDNFFEVGSGPYEGGQAVETLTMGGEAKTTFVSLGGTTSTTDGGSSGVEESTDDTVSEAPTDDPTTDETDDSSGVTDDYRSTGGDSIGDSDAEDDDPSEDVNSDNSGTILSPLAWWFGPFVWACFWHMLHHARVT